MMRCLKLFNAVLISIFLFSCSSDDDSPAVTTMPPPTPGSNPALTSADKNTVAPCPSQAILQDATELAALKDALLTGALAVGMGMTTDGLTFLDVPFVGGDADIFKKKCGFEGFWDPVSNTDMIKPEDATMTAVTLSQLIGAGRAGICSANTVPPDTITGTGFPAAGIYRGEIKAAKGGTTWHLRLRGVASGTSAGKDFDSEGIVVPGDIEMDLVYAVNDVVTPHDDLFADIVGAFATTGDAVSFKVSRATGGTVFSVLIEIICVTKS